ncbi:sigma-70 family RNA polymerase sigma factor [Sphingobacterium sp.]|uniref:RNA polymerase sigma factor n=1 Tax=Sphingobacterium sp. TaxID=341027 RepID=UPI0028A1F131|nr:sigma-70 family RNA polymerase sigma factor [Sphingobacterium sp.]
MKSTNPIDRSIITRLKEGDELAMKELITKYKSTLAQSMMRILKSQDEVEDLLQELFIRIWTLREEINTDLSFQAFLYRIAGNLAYDRLRKLANEKRLVADYFTHLTEVYSHIEEGVFNQEIKTILDQAIEQLPEQRRRVFILCKIEGKSYEEVSKLLSISVATVNTHITNANNTLKNYFQQRPDLSFLIMLALLSAKL